MIDALGVGNKDVETGTSDASERAVPGLTLVESLATEGAERP